MNDDKWFDVVDRVKEKFEILESEKRELDPGPGSIEFIVFQGPLGKVKLERISKPLVLDTKTLGSKRMGSQASVEFIYSDTEKSQTFNAYLWNEAADDWKKIDGFNDSVL